MRRTNFLLKTFDKSAFKEEIRSQQLMMQTSMIHKITSGIYTWLPMGQRVLNKVIKIVKDLHAKRGVMELLFPTMQPAELWIKSGRIETYGKEILKTNDRHAKGLIYSPTAEEIATEIMQKYLESHKDLPKIVYNIQTKFRDEIRPRFGVMRAREFLMKDAYSFDLNAESMTKSYEKMFELYKEIFKEMEIETVCVKADPGLIGGKLSHEFHLLTPRGESEIYAENLSSDLSLQEIENEQMMTSEVEKQTSRKNHKSIEIGHLFAFGQKYSEVFNCSVNLNNIKENVYMGSYGIGISRLIGAIIEKYSDDEGIIFPEKIAPFKFIISNLNPDNKETKEYCEKIYEKISPEEVFYDDSEINIDRKISDAKLCGFSHCVFVGKKDLEKSKIEVLNRKTGEKILLNSDSLLNYVRKMGLEPTRV